MTYKALAKRILKMTVAQLNQPVKLYEGCSGNWTGVTCVIVAAKDRYREGEEPGTERNATLSNYGPVQPAAKKGEVYLCHDH